MDLFDGTLTNTSIHQSGLGSNGKEIMSTHSPELVPYHRMHFGVILWTPYFFGRSYLTVSQKRKKKVYLEGFVLLLFPILFSFSLLGCQLH